MSSCSTRPESPKASASPTTRSCSRARARTGSRSRVARAWPSPDPSTLPKGVPYEGLTERRTSGEQEKIVRGGNGPRVGICCSGGGIRAASFALGALQVLQKNRMLHGESKARYLSAVSGGSYVVGGMSSVQRSIEAGDGSPEVPAFSADSPEERRLRNRLAYLTHGPGGLPGAVWRLLLGILVNVVLLGSTVIIAAVVAGWIYGEILPQLRWYYGDKHAGHRYASTKIVPPTWLLVGLLAFLGVAVLLGLVSVIVRRSWSATGRAISGALVVLVGVVAVFALGLPQL